MKWITSFKKSIIRPIKTLHEIALANNFVLGIVIFVLYSILSTYYTFSEGIQEKNIKTLFLSPLIASFEDMRFIQSASSYFSYLLLKFVIFVVVLFFVLILVNRSRYHISKVVCAVSVAYLFPLYILTVGVFLKFLPLYFIIVNLCDVIYFISFYELLGKIFGLTKDKSLFTTIIFVLLILFINMWI